MLKNLINLIGLAIIFISGCTKDVAIPETPQVDQYTFLDSVCGNYSGTITIIGYIPSQPPQFDTAVATLAFTRNINSNYITISGYPSNVSRWGFNATYYSHADSIGFNNYL